MIVDATELPVSADLESGFGDTPESVAETVQLAADVGLVGCTIEDTTGNPARPLYDLTLAVERIAAGAEAARSLGFPFLLTARAHNLMYANPSLDETIKRLHAFERAGADVLFAPGLPDLDAVRSVCGVKRISLATSLYRAAMTGFLQAVSEIKNSGQFGFVDHCTSTQDLLKLMQV